jgi:hypothetical protein
MSEIFENALDSLRVGIKFYVENSIDTSHKHAILNIFHSIELLLKEKLYRIHPILIYKDIDKRIRDDSLTVGLKEIFSRFKNLGISSPTEESWANEMSILISLQHRRNRIEHHRYEKTESDSYVIGKAIKFIYDFLPLHLNCTLEEHIDEELWNNIREIVQSYEERLKEAEEIIKRDYTPRKDEGGIFPTTCPQCFNQTLVIETRNKGYCVFCRETFEIEQCQWCSEYFYPSDINEIGMCEKCMEERWEKD